MGRRAPNKTRNTLMNTTTSPGQVPTESSKHTVWIVGGVLAIASLAAAAGIGLRSAASPAPAPGPAPVASLNESLAPGESVVDARRGTPVPPVDAPRRSAPAPVPHARAPQPLATAPVAEACRSCGVVESVQAVQRKGEGTGVGAVAGGVVGALLGNQMGRGDGRKAMTVIGAVGGGVAGHEIEKRSRSTTVYQVRVRMEDGSVRTLEQSRAPAVGERVTVQGSTLKPIGSARA